MSKRKARMGHIAGPGRELQILGSRIFLKNDSQQWEPQKHDPEDAELVPEGSHARTPSVLWGIAAATTGSGVLSRFAKTLQDLVQYPTCPSTRINDNLKLRFLKKR